MKKWVLFVFSIAILFKLYGQDSNVVINYNYFQPRDTDSISYVKIDSSLIKQTDTIAKIVMARYKNDSYNFLDSTIRIDNRKFVNRNAIKWRREPEQWIVFLFLSIVFLFTIIRNVYNKTLSVIFQAYWNDRAIGQFTRDDNFFKLRNSIMYFILFSMVYGILLKYIFNNFGVRVRQNDFDEYLFICGFSALFYLSKFILMKIAGYVFSIQKLMSGYLSIISISNFVYSIFIIPLLILYNYIPDGAKGIVFYLILILFCFNTVYKYLRTGSFILNNFQFPKFYLFIYLCSLEIMPLLIIYKLFLA